MIRFGSQEWQVNVSYFFVSSPFGYNEFDGAGSGYAIKFASLSNVDENVVVGSTPATGKSFRTDKF